MMDELPQGPFALIEGMRKTLTALKLCPVSEDELVDVAGEVKALVAALTEYRKGLEAEMPAKATGKGYRATESRTAKRSYNTNGILAAFSRAKTPRGASVPFWNHSGYLGGLLEADAVRLTWRWTELKAMAERYDVTLTVAHHEIEDGDPDALIGEVWSSRIGTEAVEMM